MGAGQCERVHVMRRTRRLALGVVLATFLSVPAIAVEPDDQPWDEIDRVLKEAPGSEAGQSSPEAPAATAQAEEPDALPSIENDRLESQRALAPQPAAPDARALEPTLAAPAAQPAPLPVVPQAPAAGAQPAPAPAAVKTAEPAAVVPPAASSPAVPTPAAAPSSPTPAVQTAQPPATAPAPAAAPAATAAAARADGLLYLPVKAYFETKAAVALKDYEVADRTALLQYYDANMGQALWVTKQGFNAAAQTVIAELKRADDWGLAHDDYKVHGLAKIGAGEFSEDDLVDAEVKLSLVAMQYARHARGFRIYNPTEQLSSYIDRQPQLIEPAKVIAALVSAPDKASFLRDLHPKHAQFERLRQKLIALRADTNKEEFEKIPDGPKITPGKSHWQVGLVRKRLKVPSPGLKPDGTAADENYFDAQLARAVERYKEKNELTPVNTTITQELRKALNSEGVVSEELLLANMEQWRWMPAELGATHVAVNIPEFTVRVMKNDAVIHSERIITGKYETQTPVFSDRMRTVVFQPSWNVPESIKVNELLPKLRAGGNPIASQGLAIKRNNRNIDVWDIDWETADIRHYHVYQPPGDANVLGIVKFLFPNKHAVYLHDTPTKKLFNEKVRMYSHGCMRVRNPVRLAEVIMAEDKGWDKSKINELIGPGPEDNDIALDKPMPVHVTYFTAWVDDDGKLKTFADVYGHQKRIILGLEGRWSEIVKNRDHLLPAEPDEAPVARNRDDWGDSDGYVRRAPRQPRYTYRAPPPPPPVKKQQKTVGEILQQVFGGF